MNLIGRGEELQRRLLRGERLSRRERRDLNDWAQWRTLLELEHICAAMKGMSEPGPDDSPEALGQLSYADEVDDA